jgi:hypothetical protein
MLLSVLFSPVLIDAQEIYRQTRSLEEQQAISHIGQAEYYVRMALRFLEASEKIGKAPYFNYQSAREDIDKILTEFKTYLKGDEFADLQPAVPLIIDGKYFAESLKNSLATLESDAGQSSSNSPAKSKGSPLAASKTPAKSAAPTLKKSVPKRETDIQQQNSATVFPPPVLAPQSSKAKRDKIEEILKKGL